MSENNTNRNPYTGMTMATSDNGNGEVVKVEDLINKPQKEWEQFTPKDTLSESDSELFSLNDELSEMTNGLEDKVKIEDFINRDNYNTGSLKEDDLSLNKDSLISSLTSTLNM